MFTSAQMITIVANLRASVVPQVVAALAARRDGELADWLNTPQATKAWRFVDRDTIFRVLEPVELDNITQASKREAFWNLILHVGGLDVGRVPPTGTPTGPKLITDLFGNTPAPITRAALLNAASSQNATRAELMFASTSLASATPPTAITAVVLTATGMVDAAELSILLNA